MSKKRHNWKKLLSGRQICARCSIMRERANVAPFASLWEYFWERPRNDSKRAADYKTYCP